MKLEEMSNVELVNNHDRLLQEYICTDVDAEELGDSFKFIVKRLDSLAATQRENETIRTILWLNHGHSGLYGDDGEKQCGGCIPNYDYKRGDLVTTTKQAFSVLHGQLATVTAERDNLKCCGNCKLQGYSEEEHLYCSRTNEEYYTRDYCDFWESDLLTKEERQC